MQGAFHWWRLTLIFLFILIGKNLESQQISPMLVGNNVWYIDPSTEVWELTRQAGVQSMRIGGHAYDDNMPSNTQLLNWVNMIQSMGAEPIMQVSQYNTPEEAAALVRFFNVNTNGNVAPIKYWNIGNEPWLQNDRPALSTVGAMVEAYFKPIAAAMKEVDPTIKIYGPDFCYYITEAMDDLFGGKNDIAGKIPGKDYYYCDGISWHLYPQDDNIKLAYAGLEQFKSAIIQCKTKIDEVNELHNRAGEEALGWGIGEFNAKGGEVVHTWGNGQMFGGIYNYCMKYGATYTTTWSMFENGGSRQGTDFSFIDGENMTPRPTYRHMQMIAQHFRGQYLSGSSSLKDMVVFGSKYNNTISVMIMNRADSPSSYTLHLKDTSFSQGQANLTVQADTPIIYEDIIAGLSTKTLVFADNKVNKTTYSNTHFENELAPSVFVLSSSTNPPGVPKGLNSTASTYKSITLNWEIYETDTLTGLLLERKATPEAKFQLVAILDPEAIHFIDGDLTHLTSYSYRIQAYNTAGKSSYSDEIVVTTTDLPENQSFNGPHIIPGRIQTEDYNDNEEGIGYHDAETENRGGVYRPDQGVDIEICTDTDGGYNVAYIEDGEWLNYLIESITPGSYDIAIRTASNTNGTKKITLNLDGEMLGSVNLQNTGGWQKWETYLIENISLEEGKDKNLKLSMEGNEFNINWIEFIEKEEMGLSNLDKNAIKAYYNSNTNALIIELDNPENKIIITLYDLAGKEYFRTIENKFHFGEFKVDTPEGLYVLSLQAEGDLVAMKIAVN